ncbi:MULTISPECIES: phosphoribosylglycinamide formyltransferase [Pacificibacter]|uniref:phosphoribosylglycinamide formyltransferase n=1 Tax=Pacificibacter TaxID=1042323 RepID=UPI001C094F99|nr:phosphoribosylglycinamide formyltransferase [Pacificibacter sp. 1_MG-2023]MBU2936922.1 phosphoribosylglycinamide formyltransferase [Pacificibacter marinus]MDO6614916.1 phosphoribosylglycinamide formyltransferase [Pacificibacter sp. 1_MG-2023]
MKKVAILISGSGSNMVTLAQSMTGDHPARPCVVLSNRPDAGGLAKAEALGIPTVVVDHKDYKGDRAAFDTAVMEALAPYDPDVVALAGFMRILTPEFISHFAGKMLNIHPSLLPKYKGLHTHQRAIDAGDEAAGCSVHEVTAELDGGPILAQGRVPILAGDTADALAARVLPVEHRLYPETLRRFVSGDRTRVDV